MTPVELLNKLDLIPPGQTTAGSLAVEARTVATAAEALAALRTFGGAGWLCATDAQTIRRFSANEPLPELPPEAWPLAGEAANGDTSLHLTRVGDGWRLTTLRRTAGAGVRLASMLQARDGGPDLRYETACTAATAAGLEELRPVAFRFTGFANPDARP